MRLSTAKPTEKARKERFPRCPARSPVLFGVISLVALLAPALASADPRLTVPKAQLRSALRCRGKVSRARHEPVLLVPGTGSEGSDLFPTGFQVGLSAKRVPSCYLNPPGKNLVDLQVSTQYVVFGVRWMAKRARQPVAVFGFSQGGVLARMALTYWPRTRPLVSDVVSASAPQHGSTNLPSDYCPRFGCAAALWQRSPNSQLLAALNAGDETPGKTAWTTLRTLDDTIAEPVDGPQPTSALRGARNLVIQAICPGRQVEHLGMAFDSVVYAALRDAMRHKGPARAERLRRSCGRQFVGGVTADQISALNSRITANILAAPKLAAEPPVTLRRRGTRK